MMNTIEINIEKKKFITIQPNSYMIINIESECEHKWKNVEVGDSQYEICRKCHLVLALAGDSDV